MHVPSNVFMKMAEVANPITVIITAERKKLLLQARLPFLFLPVRSQRAQLWSNLCDWWRAAYCVLELQIWECSWNCRYGSATGTADMGVQLELQIWECSWNCRYKNVAGTADMGVQLELQIWECSWNCRYGSAAGTADMGVQLELQIWECDCRAWAPPGGYLLALNRQ
jgi:hypothetical protein